MTTDDPALRQLARLLGEWTTEATHPMMPGVVVHGTARGEWLEGERFLLFRARTDHPQFPDSICVIGYVDDDRVDQRTHELPANGRPRRLVMHYYDSRGVFRVQDTSVDDGAWRWERIVPGFSQRFVGTFEDGGDRIVGRSTLREDDVHWKDDLVITYTRRR